MNEAYTIVEVYCDDDAVHPDSPTYTVREFARMGPAGAPYGFRLIKLI